MKSQQQDQKIKTNCKNCAFAIYDQDEKTQISCAHDRINKFQPDVAEAYDNEKEFYVIDRLCTYYRNRAWGYSEQDTDKVKKESALSFDIIFDCNLLTKSKIDSIIKFVNNNEYYKEKINIILLHEHSNYEAAKSGVSQIGRELNNPFTISVCYNIKEFMYKFLIKTKNTYHVLVQHPEKLDSNILIKLNDYVNVEMKKFIAANNNENKFIGNFTYKALNNFEPGINYFENINLILESCKNLDLYIEI